MTEYTVKDIIDFSAKESPTKVMDAFDSIIRQKAATQLNNYREMVAQNMFSPEQDADDDLDLDGADDDLDLDDEDLDLDLDVDVDLDLDDLDLDNEDDEDGEDA
jgi:hypothetical protein